MLLRISFWVVAAFSEHYIFVAAVTAGGDICISGGSVFLLLLLTSCSGVSFSKRGLELCLACCASWPDVVSKLRCRPELCVSDKSWVHISFRLASVFASDPFLPSVMDKCTGVSTAWLLIAVLGVLCNVSVPGVLAENPPGLHQSTANLLACAS